MLDLQQLAQARCATGGGNPAAVIFVRATFVDGISTSALMRRMARDEAGVDNHGSPGQIFRIVLRADKNRRLRCRLRAIGTMREGGSMPRHLRRDHFRPTSGTGQWQVAYATGGLRRHRCAAGLQW
jgi:hypothetical protein